MVYDFAATGQLYWLIRLLTGEMDTKKRMDLTGYFVRILYQATVRSQHKFHTRTRGRHITEPALLT